MRVLLVADMRSPHSVGWVHGLTMMGVEPLVLSSRRLSRAERAALPPHVARTVIHEPSDALSRARAATTAHPGALASIRSLARGGRARDTRSPGQSVPEGTGIIELPLELRIARRLGRTIAALADAYQPDLVHALRVPFEGIAATEVAAVRPTVISIWGQDLARQAPAAPRLGHATRAALANVHGVHADCQRDVRLAHEWGAPRTALDLVAAGNMGYDEELFTSRGTRFKDRTLVTCPRGPGSHINYSGFLRVADRLTRSHPNVTFVAARLSDIPSAEEIHRRAAHSDRIILTRDLSHAELADIYRRSLVVVSPSISDGTPNSVLEGMSCGAVPVVGDIDPLRDLLGQNLPAGLVDPLDEAEMESRIAALLDAPEDAWRCESELAQQIAVSGWSREATVARVRAWYEELTR